MNLEEINKAILINHLLHLYDYEIEVVMDLEIKCLNDDPTLFESINSCPQSGSTYIYQVLAGEVKLISEVS
jgi:hypothetical protein